VLKSQLFQYFILRMVKHADQHRHKFDNYKEDRDYAVYRGRLVRQPKRDQPLESRDKR